MARKTRSRTRRASRTASRRSAMVLSRTNYVILGACVAAIILGYALMRIENEVDGFISLYVSPIILMAGYIGVIVAILYRSRPQEEAAQ